MSNALQECPWCGAEPMTVGRGLAKPLPAGQVRWQCGSHKAGRRPWQDVNCKRNVAEAEGERLERMLLFALDALDVGLQEFTERFEAAEAST